MAAKVAGGNNSVVMGPPLSIPRLGVWSTVTEWIAVALLGQEHSPQPPRQEANFRLRSIVTKSN